MESAIDENPLVSFELAAGRGAWGEGGASQPASSCMHRQGREYNLLSEGSMYLCWSFVTGVPKYAFERVCTYSKYVNMVTCYNV